MIKRHTEKTSYDPTMSYVFGFLFSILLTIVPYLLVVNDRLSGNALIGTLVAVALAQMVIQLFFFLHMGREPKPRWNLLVFLFMVLIVLIVVIGSLWIMNNLDYNMMPEEVERYIEKEELIDKTDTR
jgi:cytochrome o ubiquinol oxidase subunit IV